MARLLSNSLSIAMLIIMVGCAGDILNNTAKNIDQNQAKDIDVADTQIRDNKVSENDAINTALTQADLAYRSNQAEKATHLLTEATSNYPANKLPWLRIAQAKFDAGKYGEAIDNSLEALIRDPKENVAHSILVVSGLRLATHSLNELRSQNGISGSLKSEAEDLAAIIKDSLGESNSVSRPTIIQGTTPIHQKNTMSESPKKFRKPQSNSVSKKLAVQTNEKPLSAKANMSVNPFDVLR
jgi:hypothetical protein